MDDRTKSILIACIQAAFGNREIDISIDEGDLKPLCSVAKRQAILPVFIVGLKNIGCSALFDKDLSKLEARFTYDYIQRREALREISQALNSASIDYIPLKGSVLRDLYPNPCMRTSSDIDVLVRENDLTSAIATLEEHTSFKYFMTGHHDAHLMNTRLHLELHFSLLTNLEKLDSVLQKAWQYAHKTDVGSCYTFSPNYHVFYITAHAAKHFIKEGGLGIRPLLDIWVLRTKTQFDENAVRTLCEEAGIFGFYEMCCALLNVWFNDVSHTRDTKDFEDIVFSGGVFGSNHIKIVAHGRKYSGAKYVVRRVFKSSSDIKELYPVCMKHPSLVPFYQAVRWTHLLKGSKRNAVHKELREAWTLDPSEIEKYDRLMKRMKFEEYD